MRKVTKSRKTNETDIKLIIDLDGTGQATIETGIPFFNHMLNAFTLYSHIDLTIETKGDLEVDDHHLVEDIGIVLGKALQEALGDKRGINRYADNLTPMDEALARIAMDISNRPFLDYNGEFYRDEIGGLSLENIREFLYAFAMESRITLHIDIIKGRNDHHKAEAIFKGLGRALSVAKSITDQKVLSTKGTLS